MVVIVTSESIPDLKIEFLSSQKVPLSLLSHGGEVGRAWLQGASAGVTLSCEVCCVQRAERPSSGVQEGDPALPEAQVWTPPARGADLLQNQGRQGVACARQALQRAAWAPHAESP